MGGNGWLTQKFGAGEPGSRGAGSRFGLKSQKSKPEKKYRQLLEEAYQLSHTDRKKSDEKAAAADEVRKQLDEVRKTVAK